MFSEFRGIRIHYTSEGSGLPVIFLHGWGCDGGIWDSFVPALVSSGRMAVRVDFPGFGKSEEPPQVWGVEEYTQCLEDLCARLGIGEPCLVGHSFGGRVAILFASRNPVRRVVLADAAGIRPHHGLSYHMKVYSYKLVKWWTLKVLSDREAFEKRRASAGSADYRNASPRMKAVLSKVVNEDLRRVMPSIKAPVLLFWGSEDTATPLSDARKMERLIPDAGLVVVQGADHFSFLRDPVRFAAVLDNFLV